MLCSLSKALCRVVGHVVVGTVCTVEPLLTDYML